MTNPIQQILDQQRKESKIHTASARSIAASERTYNPEWKDAQDQHNEKQRGRSWVKDAKENDDPAYLEWKKLHDAGTAKNPDNPEWLAKIQERNRTKNVKPEHIAKVKAGLERYVEANGDVIKARNRVSNTNPEHIANRKAGIKDFFADPIASAAAREARSKANSKPFHCGEHGDFKSFTAAGKFLFEHKLTTRSSEGSVRKWLMKQMEINPTDFYFIKEISTQQVISSC